MSRWSLPLPLFIAASLAAFSSAQTPSAADAAPQRLADIRGVWNADFNHDASRLIVRLRSGGVTLWDAVQGSPAPSEIPPGRKATGHVMSGDAKLVLIGFEDETQVFDATTGAAVSPLLKAKLSDQFPTAALFSSTHETVLIFEQTEATAWELPSGKKVATIPTPPGDDETVPPSALFTRDGSHCFIMDRKGTVTRYDAKSWKPAGKPMRHPAAEMAYEFGFAASADGKWLATFDHPGENGPTAHLQLWDAVASKPLGKPVVAVNGLSAQFLSTRNRVLVTPARGDAHVRELPSGKTVFKTRAHDEVDGPSATISPDEKWILTWGPDRRIDSYDAATGKLSSNYPGHAAIARVLLAPDSTTTFLALENTAFLLQEHHDHYLVKLKIPELDVLGAARILEYLHRTSLSPDGRRLMAQQGQTDEERIVLYDTATMREIEWPSR